MKAWTLIVFYLSKDIWSRWLEHPGAALARLVVGVLLAALLLLAQAGFALTGRSLETRVAALGAGTLLVSEAVGPRDPDRASLDELLAPLSERAEVLAFRQLPVPARDPLVGEEVLLLAYGLRTAVSLAPALALAPEAALHYVTSSLPPGIPVEIELEGVPRVAVTVPPPAWLARLPLFRPVVLVPAESADAWIGRGHLEFCLVLADPARSGEVPALASAIRSLLALENRPSTQLQSPESLLAEIARLEAARQTAAAAAGLAGGVVLALVFGAIAGLEYRQNRYIVALLRSFGAPAPLVLLRYAAEAALLLAFAALAARALALAAHPALFGAAGFERGLLDLNFFNPYSWPEAWLQLRWLAAGAVLSVLPIALSLRLPVGRVLP